MSTAAFDTAVKNLETKGFLDIELDPTLDLFSEIEKLKKEKCSVAGALLPGAGYTGCG